MKPSRTYLTVFLLILLVAPLLNPLSTAAQSADFASVRGSLYESPSYGWTLTFDPDFWAVDEVTSEEGIDTLTLSASEEDEIAAMVVFQTTPGDARNAEACLEETSENLESVWEGAEINAAVDSEGNAIYGEFGEPDHWIGAFIIDNDLVVEIDC